MRATVRLDGFEEALAVRLTEIYSFADEALKDVNFGNGVGRPVINRHLFVQDMIEVEDVADLFPPTDGIPDFEPETEPQIAIFTDPGIGIVPSGSSGGLQLWAIRFVLRKGTVPEEAKALLEHLITFTVRRVCGIVGSFAIKGRELLQRPHVFAREGDDHIYVDSVIRFFVVALPT